MHTVSRLFLIALSGLSVYNWHNVHLSKGDDMPLRESGGTEGRTRHVRVYLTEEEHALVRAAAAKVDKSLARFAIDAIVEVANKVVETTEAPPAEAKRPRGRGKGK